MSIGRNSTLSAAPSPASGDIRAVRRAERPSDAIVSMAARANGVGLCFVHGARLPDPNKVLLGAGHQTRFIRIDSPQVLERPEVEALVAAAIAQAGAPLPVVERGKLIVRCASAKQRPRRKLTRRSTTR
jgi:hypothetical protein